MTSHLDQRQEQSAAIATQINKVLWDNATGIYRHVRFPCCYLPAHALFLLFILCVLTAAPCTGSASRILQTHRVLACAAAGSPYTLTLVAFMFELCCCYPLWIAPLPICGLQAGGCQPDAPGLLGGYLAYLLLSDDRRGCLR